MKRRTTGVLAAAALAVVGTLLLVAYVQSAKDAAVAEERVVHVLVATRTIEEGTRASDLEGMVRTIEVPARLLSPGAIEDVADLRRRVAGADILEGEQIVRERFVAPEVAGRSADAEGKLEVTVALDPDRALGGRVKAGDKVGVLASFKPFDTNVPEAQAKNLPKKIPNETHLMLHKVAVTNVQVDRKPVETDKDDSDGPALAPTGKLLVTLALPPHAVERVVFAAEFGSIWLAAQPDDAPTRPAEITNRGNVYR